MELHVGFTGTRKGMTTAQEQKVSELFYGTRFGDEDVVFLHHGDCYGADAQADKLAAQHDMYVILHPCDIQAARAYCYGPHIVREHGVAKPLVRNHDIVDMSKILVATPSGFEEEKRSGTWATIRYAWKKKKVVVVVWPDGTSRTWQPYEED